METHSSTVEVFVNDGEQSVTRIVYADPKEQLIEVFAKGGTVSLQHIEAYQLIEQWTNDGGEADIVARL